MITHDAPGWPAELAGWRCVTDRQPRRSAYASPADLLARLLDGPRVYPTRADRDARAPLWSPTTYAPGATRAARAVLSVWALVLDLDEIPEGVYLHEWIVERWGEVDGLAHTSWSHATDRPRLRIVLPLARPVEASRWRAVYRWASEHSGQVVPDQACSDPSRIYWLPAVRSATAEYTVAAWCGGEAGRRLYLDRQPPPGEGRILADELPAWGQRCLVPQELPDPRWTPPPPLVRTALLGGPAQWERARRLREYAEPRQALGLALGGQVVRAQIRRVRCPRCADQSVWWWIEPGQQARAACNHRRSCGYSGFLDQLAQDLGLEV